MLTASVRAQHLPETNTSAFIRVIHLLLFAILLLGCCLTSSIVAESIHIPSSPQSFIKRIFTNMGQGMSTTQWYLYGRKHFRQAGYYQHLKEYNNAVQSRADIKLGMKGEDGMNLTGKAIVITGANSGIGKEMATYAAAKGANVYMICRSKDRAEKARDEIIQTTSNDNVHVVLADVGELKQVHSAVQELKSQLSSVHCLVCNAGKLLNTKTLTSEGNEATMASHLIGGAYLLSSLLTPLLEQDTDPRVVYVTSGGMYLTSFPSQWDVAMNTKPGQVYDGNMAYSYAKRGQVILASELAKRSYAKTIKFVSGHPGWTATDAVDEAFGDQKKYLEPMRTTWEGAEGLCWLMSVSGDKLENGGFYLDRKLEKKYLGGLSCSVGRNSDQEVNDFMEKLKEVCGV